MSRATQVPAFIYHLISCKGLSPATVRFSTRFYYDLIYKQRRSYYPNHAETSLVWALPRSLATTSGITVVFFSCGYLDVSVPRVRLTLRVISQSLVIGFPIRTSAGHFVFADLRSFSQLITSFFASGSHRHPPCALSSFSFILMKSTKICLNISPLVTLLSFYLSSSRVVLFR